MHLCVGVQEHDGCIYLAALICEENSKKFERHLLLHSEFEEERVPDSSGVKRQIIVATRSLCAFVVAQPKNSKSER